MPRTSNNLKKKWSVWQGKFHKRIVIGGLNILIQKQLGGDYEKSFRKDEKSTINSAIFIEAVFNARKKLGFCNSEPIGKQLREKWISDQLNQHQAGAVNRISDDENYDIFLKIVEEARESAGLSKDWNSYMVDYIIDNQPPDSTLFIHPKKIWVEDINEANELLIRLKPGLRYEDYRKAWKVFSRPLGDGARLNKPYTGEDLHLQMLKDKESGLTYKQVTVKYYPNSDPLNNIDRVKKAIQRAKKRQERDK